MTVTWPGALQTARNLVFAGTGAASAVLLLVLLVVAGRVLGEEAFGRFSFALALATVLEVLMDFGLKEVVTRNVARDRSSARHLVAHMFGVKLLLSAVGFALVLAIAFLLRPEPEVRLACALLGLSAVLRSYLLTVRHLLNGLERFGLDSLVLVSDRVLLLTFGVAALAAGWGVVGLSAAFVAARLVAFAFAHWLARGQIGPIGIATDRAEWKQLLLAAAPFGLFIAVLNLYSYVDTLMLGVMRTDQETGLYSASHRVYEGVVSFASILGTITGPRLAREFVQNRQRHAWLARAAVTAAVVAAVPLSLAVGLGARPIVTQLFGEPFAPAAAPLRILVAGLVFVFPLQVMHTVAISVNEERLLVRAATAGCILNIMLNVALIPPYGMNGSASATVISEGVSLALVALGIRRKTRRDSTTLPVAVKEGAGR